MAQPIERLLRAARQALELRQARRNREARFRAELANIRPTRAKRSRCERRSRARKGSRASSPTPTRRSTRSCRGSRRRHARAVRRSVIPRTRAARATPAASATRRWRCSAKRSSSPSATRCLAPTSIASMRCTCWASPRPRRRAARLEPQGARRRHVVAGRACSALGADRSTTTSAGPTSSVAIPATALDALAEGAAVARSIGQCARPSASRSGRSRADCAPPASSTRPKQMQLALVAETEARQASPTATCTKSSPRSRSRSGDNAAARPWAGKAHALLQGRSRHGSRTADSRLAALAEGKVAVNPAKRRAIFERLRAGQSRIRRPSSRYTTPFELLVAVVLSAQATDKSVNKATARLFPGGQHAGGDRQARRRRPHAVHQRHRPVSQQGEERRGAVGDPRAASTAAKCRANREALEALPGVGRKTANVVLNIAFGEPTIAVDTHIFRVANRTGPRAGRRRRSRSSAGSTSSRPTNSSATRITG